MPAPTSTTTSPTWSGGTTTTGSGGAAAYVNPFADLVRPERTRNWDSDRRLRELDADGIVAEVLFPNTVPPFFPSGSLVAMPPTPEDYELRAPGCGRTTGGWSTSVPRRPVDAPGWRRFS